MREFVSGAYTDGRPLVILCFTDCDPTGYGIPASVARKAQAMLRLAGSDLWVQVIPAALTVEQAERLNLPSTPMKLKEKRADRWGALTGRDQTEIDALAALQADVLVQIARNAIAPFYDTGLARRAKEARWNWEHSARELVATRLDRMPQHGNALTQLRWLHSMQEQVQTVTERTINDLRRLMNRVVDSADLPDLPVLPEWQQPAEEAPSALFDSRDTFVANTRRLQAAKLRDVGADSDFDDREGETDSAC